MSSIMITLKMFLFLLSVAAIWFFISQQFLAADWLQFQDQRLCACEKCLLEDPLLFNSSFNSSVEPFLCAEHNLTEDAFYWWKEIQLEKCNFSVYEATVKKIFETFPPRPDLPELRPDRCRTCAVVGNSVNLKRSHYGPLIDHQDVVIRVNAAPIKGYEADVGTRTTHHVMYPESAVDLDNTTHLVLFPFKISDLMWLIKAFTTGFSGVSYAPIKSKVQANKDLVMVLSPAFMKYIHDLWLEKEGSYPSTGFMALILALHICDEVHVFGFGADSKGRWSHYWEKLKDKEFKTGVHPGHHEYNVIQQLAENKIITFYKGQ
ncbi:CMP-N-acetylneuraminate-beta-galactosamide-alpha-2,3-sialyltransferase 1-like [Melanotaenia boesemani]|uniref:CMP-N-acetylneuraminate-beta-galactosamide- alpha-2,3-sialyltransferase 1-like n=1 Tax=Melanotaenia boesemani TaxID=1250792 RepID=UPI001C04B39B|nr:CMP-N-acetylneuraminate-beta-galactosamide-alpha-2,3-sialyltransferase 1-like [Melanotaenia boesemani]